MELSLVSNDGRGLKLLISESKTRSGRLSLVSNDGRGLKPWKRLSARKVSALSLVSNDGRGLKLLGEALGDGLVLFRSSAMTGVD